MQSVDSSNPSVDPLVVAEVSSTLIFSQAVEKLTQGVKENRLSEEEIRKQIDEMEPLLTKEHFTHGSSPLRGLLALEEAEPHQYKHPYPALLLLLKYFKMESTPTKDALQKEIDNIGVFETYYHPCELLRCYSQLRKEWHSHSDSSLTSYWQALQKAIFNTFIASSQNWFISFPWLEEEAVKGILNDLWEDGDIRKQFLDRPYFVLRLLPYKHLLPGKGAQELTQTWQNLWDKEMASNKSLKQTGEPIDFSRYASQVLWKDGIGPQVFFTEQELKYLPAVMNILFSKYDPSLSLKRLPFSERIFLTYVPVPGSLAPVFYYRDPIAKQMRPLFGPTTRTPWISSLYF